MKLVNAPVILFAYRREALTKRVLDALSDNYLAESTDVFVYVNNCNPGSGDEQKVTETRKMLLEYKGNFISYTVILREKPYGIRATMMSALDDIFNKYDRVIVLEDDIMPSRNFLNFMNTALEKYYSDDDMFSVCGFTASEVDCKGDSYKSNIFCSWGYALWRDKYRQCDSSKFNDYLYGTSNIHRMIREMPVYFPFITSYTFFLTDDFFLDALLYLYQFSNDKYTLFPKNSVCSNICDGDSISKITASRIDSYRYNYDNPQVEFELDDTNVSDILSKNDYAAFVNFGNWYQFVSIEHEAEKVFGYALRNATSWLAIKNIPFDHFFRKRNICRIAIYACGDCGLLLYRMLKDSDFVKIVYAMDRDVHCRLSDDIPTYRGINKDCEIDAVIVTYAADFNNIRLSLDFDDDKIFDVISMMIENVREFDLRKNMRLVQQRQY